MTGKPRLCEVYQFVVRNNCQHDPFACSMLALQPVCQLSDCCLSGLECVWLYSFSLKVGYCCQAFAIQICYCLLAHEGQLRGAGAVYVGCAQAGVQLDGAACIQAWGCLRCVCGVMAWRLSHCRCKKPVFVSCLPIPAGASCRSRVAATAAGGCSCMCAWWFG